jgi:hypothetical protein
MKSQSIFSQLMVVSVVLNLMPLRLGCHAQVDPFCALVGNGSFWCAGFARLFLFDFFFPEHAYVSLPFVFSIGPRN